MNGQRVAPWKFDVLKASRFALEALLLGQTDVTKIWNGERGMGVWERVDSGNPSENSEWRTKERKGNKRGSFTVVKVSFFRLCPQMTRTFLLVQS